MTMPDTFSPARRSARPAAPRPSIRRRAVEHGQHLARIVLVAVGKLGGERGAGGGPHRELSPGGAAGIAGVREPLDPVPVLAALGLGQHRDRQIGGAVQHRRLAQQRPGEAERLPALADDPDDATLGQGHLDRRQLEPAVLGEHDLGLGPGGVAIGEPRAERHLAVTGREGEEVPVKRTPLPQPRVRSGGAAGDLGEVRERRAAARRAPPPGGWRRRA